MKNKKVKIPAGVSRDIGVMIEHFDEKITFIAEQVAEHTVQLSDIKGTLDKHTEDIEIIKTDIEFIKHELRNKVDRNEFIALERRVALLESRR